VPCNKKLLLALSSEKYTLSDVFNNNTPAYIFKMWPQITQTGRLKDSGDFSVLTRSCQVN